MNETLYLLDCGLAKSSWKAWQQTLFAAARKFDRQLFTKAQIVALGHYLNNLGASCRGYSAAISRVRLPDWDFCADYNVDPAISLGEGCTIVFRRTAGQFTGK